MVWRCARVFSVAWTSGCRSSSGRAFPDHFVIGESWKEDVVHVSRSKLAIEYRYIGSILLVWSLTLVHWPFNVYSDVSGDHSCHWTRMKVKEAAAMCCLLLLVEVHHPSVLRLSPAVSFMRVLINFATVHMSCKDDGARLIYAFINNVDWVQQLMLRSNKFYFSGRRRNKCWRSKGWCVLKIWHTKEMDQHCLFPRWSEAECHFSLQKNCFVSRSNYNFQLRLQDAFFHAF